jgi:uncharacterized protein with NAD-binding domain and iron-sulfur cluster
VERGFEVHVFERNPLLGGKCRTWGLPGTGTAGRADLPAEHGFRFFPGFYTNLTDSMQRTPRPGRGDTAYDSLHQFGELHGFSGGLSLGPKSSAQFGLPGSLGADPARLDDPVQLVGAIARVVAMLANAAVDAPLMPVELADLVNRILVYATSSWERRRGQWEKVSWWRFLDGDHRSTVYQQFALKGVTSILQASKSERAATLSTGNIVDAFLWNVLGLGQNSRTGWLARGLDGPTGDVWINPWARHLARLGVRFHTQQSLAGFEVSRGWVSAATVVDPAGRTRRVEADWFLPAIGIEQAKPIFLAPRMLAADPWFEQFRDLNAGWMNNIEIYFRAAPRNIRNVLVIPDHPWSLSGVFLPSQWQGEFAGTYGDGSVSSVLSLVIANWGEGRGTTLVGKPASECTRQEVFAEVWATLKQRFGADEPALRDEANVARWVVDPAIRWANGDSGPTTNDDQLTVHEVNTWSKRPDGPTGLPNLFIAGDWSATNGYVGAMECASQSARQAVQKLIDSAGKRAEPVPCWDYFEPKELDPIKREDAGRYRSGLPNVFDLDPGRGGEARDAGARSPVHDLATIIEDATHQALRGK